MIFPHPEQFCGLSIELENAVFRKGAASKAGVDFLRFIDIGIHDQSGRIESNLSEKHNVSPDQGISLYLKKMIPDGMVALDDSLRKMVDKSHQVKIHWWSIELGQPIPSGLILKYDGVPPGALHPDRKQIHDRAGVP